MTPVGKLTVSADFEVADSGLPDPFEPGARQIPVQDLPDEVLIYLLGSRYCDTDKLSQTAWSLFGTGPEGWGRVQAIVDYVHERIRFDYQRADATRTAHDGFMQREGVCRDFAHLAITFCRCMNIPARYATGYLGDIGVPKDPAPMDFSAWFEVYLEGPPAPVVHVRCPPQPPPDRRIVMARGGMPPTARSPRILATRTSPASTCTRTRSAETLTPSGGGRPPPGSALAESRDRHAPSAPVGVEPGGEVGQEAPLVAEIGRS